MNSTSSCRNSSSIRNSLTSGFIAPVSSREMSSSAPNISSTASSEASMLVMSWASSLGTAEFGIEAGQFLGALLHPPLQRFVGALEILRRLHARGDVGEGRDDAAI